MKDSQMLTWVEDFLRQARNENGTVDSDLVGEVLNILRSHNSNSSNKGEQAESPAAPENPEFTCGCSQFQRTKRCWHMRGYDPLEGIPNARRAP